MEFRKRGFSDILEILNALDAKKDLSLNEYDVFQCVRMKRIDPFRPFR